MKATNAVGDGTWSAISTFLIAEPPSPPVNLLMHSFDNTLVFFQWGQPVSTGGQATIGFKVYRKDCSLSENEAVLIMTLPASQFAFTDSSVDGGRIYKYYVTAYN